MVLPEETGQPLDAWSCCCPDITKLLLFGLSGLFHRTCLVIHRLFRFRGLFACLQHLHAATLCLKCVLLSDWGERVKHTVLFLLPVPVLITYHKDTNMTLRDRYDTVVTDMTQVKTKVTARTHI